MKRLVVISDPHCGHITGMTPPEYRMKRSQSKEIHDHQKETWEELKKIANESRKANDVVLVSNGDTVQGNIHEPWISCLETQQDMAIKTLQLFRADENFVVRGTPVHTCAGIDLERRVATELHAPIKNELFLSVEKHMCYFRHKIGRSVLPHGKFTSVARKAVEQIYKSGFSYIPKPKLCCFGHVHYFAMVGDVDWTAVACPALQTYSDFGEKMCDGIVHWGILWWDIENGKIVDVQKRIQRVEASYPEVFEV